MPKDIVLRKAKGNIYRDHPPGRKLKLGPRSSGKPANSMTNADLIAFLDNADKKRYHKNARTVLKNRGVVA